MPEAKLRPKNRCSGRLYVFTAWPKHTIFLARGTKVGFRFCADCRELVTFGLLARKNSPIPPEMKREWIKQTARYTEKYILQRPRYMIRKPIYVYNSCLYFWMAWTTSPISRSVCRHKSAITLFSFCSMTLDYTKSYFSRDKCRQVKWTLLALNYAPSIYNKVIEADR